jgi:hypothetical protein
MTDTHTRFTPAGGDLVPDAPDALPHGASRKAATWAKAAGPAFTSASGPAAQRGEGEGPRRNATSPLHGPSISLSRGAEIGVDDESH